MARPLVGGVQVKKREWALVCARIRDRRMAWGPLAGARGPPPEDLLTSHGWADPPQPEEQPATPTLLHPMEVSSFSAESHLPDEREKKV